MSSRTHLSLIASALLLLAGTSISRAANITAEAQTSPQTAATQTPGRAVEPEAHRTWRLAMSRRQTPRSGCFKASYPNTEWQEVPCNTSGDYSAQTTGIISSAVGSFKSVDGASSVQGEVGGVSPTKANVFELQLNTQFFPNPPACNHVSGCLGWQQFLYSQTQCSGPCVFMEYWLLNYGSSCPSGSWQSDGFGDCWYNGPAKDVPTQTVADLPNLTLTATAGASGGQDTAVIGTTSGDLNAVGQDSVLSLDQSWNTAEFNIFGDCCSTETSFSNPTTLVLKTTIDDGTSNPPSCGTSSYTAETNNLTLAPTTGSVCCPYGGATPSIEFMETNAGHTASCGPTALEGDPHITTVDGTHYDFQGAGEFISLRDSDGEEIQTRQTPVSTTFIGTDAHDDITSCVSLNTAVAARVGEHRVTYEPNLSGVPDPSGLQLRIDGSLTTLGSGGLNLGNGGRVLQSFGGALEVDFPDGKTLLVTPEWWAGQSKWYLNVDVTHLGLMASGSNAVIYAPAYANLPPVGGIAGPIPEGSWIPALPNGASLGAMPGSIPQRYETLYRKFADAWRVTDKDSLFDYAPGTSTETFTRKDWPLQRGPCVVPNTRPVEPATEAFAQAACRRVSGTTRHSDCVFDVRATGFPGFAKTYLVTQRILADSTTTSLTADTDPSQAGETVAFTASVASNSTTVTGVPSGSVQFMVDGANAGMPVAVDARGRATFETSRLKVGTHHITASFVPASASLYLPSTSAPKTQIVRRCFCEAERAQK
jgi:hypothetical protein